MALQFPASPLSFPSQNQATYSSIKSQRYPYTCGASSLSSVIGNAAMSAGTTSFSAIFPRLYLQIFATAEIAFSVAFTFSRLLDSGPFMTWKSKGTTSETWKHGSVLKTWSRVDRILRKSGSGSIQSHKHKTGFTLGNIWSRLRILLSMTKYQTCTGCDIFLSPILSHHSASITRSLSNKYTGSVNDTF